MADDNEVDEDHTETWAFGFTLIGKGRNRIEALAEAKQWFNHNSLDSFTPDDEEMIEENGEGFVSHL